MKTIEHWIGGTATTGASTRRSTVWNPATGEAQAEVVLAEPSDVDGAVQAAKRAHMHFPTAYRSDGACKSHLVSEPVGAAHDIPTVPLPTALA